MYSAGQEKGCADSIEGVPAAARACRCVELIVFMPGLSSDVRVLVSSVSLSVRVAGRGVGRGEWCTIFHVYKAPTLHLFGN